MIKFAKIARSFTTLQRPYLASDRHKPDMQQQLTFNKMGLLREIVDVLNRDMNI